jgi:hypothetical protein
MPVWAAVLLPILTGLIGVLGGLYGTWLGVAQSRDQERRRILGEAAGEFAKAIGGAANAVAYALHAGPGSGAPVNEAENLVGEAANLVPPVELLFNDPTGRAAQATRHELRAAVTALRRDKVAEAQEAYERAETHRTDFHRQARDAIWRGHGDSRPRLWSSRNRPPRS